MRVRAPAGCGADGARPGRCGPRPRRGARRALTLIELLVVLIILSILGAIGYGSWVATRNDRRTRYAATLVADLIRQARNTAVSSGAPVTLRIVEAQGTYVVEGAVQTPIYAEQFEGTSTNTGVDDQLPGTHPGYAGRGFGFETLAGVSTREPLNIALPARPAALADEYGGFFLECAVYLKPTATPGRVEALALADDDDRIENNEFLVSLDLVPVGTAPLVRWHGSTSVRQKENTAEPDPYLVLPATAPGDAVRRYRGGEWARLGVAVRDGLAILYQEGVEVARTVVDPLPDQELPLFVVIGTDHSADFIIDNIRLYRLGIGARTRLPRGILPVDGAGRPREFATTFAADGSVDGDGSIRLRGPVGRENLATLSITATGVTVGYADLTPEGLP